MCLVLNDNPEPQIAEEDIVVYKFVHSFSRGSSGIVAPYRNYLYPPMGTLMQSALVVVPDEDMDPEYSYGCPVVEDGLHSFAHLHEVRYHVSQRPEYEDAPKIKFVKCRIPKGAMYFKGTYNGRLTSYASDQLIMDEVFGKLKAWWRCL